MSRAQASGNPEGYFRNAIEFQRTYNNRKEVDIFKEEHPDLIKTIRRGIEDKIDKDPRQWEARIRAEGGKEKVIATEVNNGIARLVNIINDPKAPERFDKDGAPKKPAPGEGDKTLDQTMKELGQKIGEGRFSDITPTELKTLEMIGVLQALPKMGINQDPGFSMFNGAIPKDFVQGQNVRTDTPSTGVSNNQRSGRDS